MLIEKLKSSWNEETGRYEAFYRIGLDVITIYTYHGYWNKYIRADIFSPTSNKWELLAQSWIIISDDETVKMLESELLDEAQMILSITKEGLNHADA